MTDATELETALLNVLHDLDTREVLADALSEERSDGASLLRAESFEDHGLLTRDRGLVLRLSDGGEFQITIVRSK